ncbi:MAG TPA: hypothetical protein P5252_05285 [Candidatus Cloacimonas sp.]|nr:hypothetical protein [Candidatus Cloacimonas sp.]
MIHAIKWVVKVKSIPLYYPFQSADIRLYLTDSSPGMKKNEPKLAVYS